MKLGNLESAQRQMRNRQRRQKRSYVKRPLRPCKCGAKQRYFKGVWHCRACGTDDHVDYLKPVAAGRRTE